MLRVAGVVGFILSILGTDPSFAHCTTRADGIKVPLRGKTRAKYAVKNVYMNGHIEYMSFDLDEFGLTEEQVLMRIQNKKIDRSKETKSYGDLHSVTLVYSPKSPEHSTETYMLRACMDVPSHRLRPYPGVKTTPQRSVK